MKLSFRLFALALVAPLALLGCSEDDEASVTPTTDSGTTTDSGASTDTATASKNIVETAAAAGSFKTLGAALKAAGLESALQGAGPFTVFAPTDDAFKKDVPDFLLTQLTSAPYKTELGLILKYHVLSGSVKAADVLGKKLTPDTLAGTGIKITADGSDGKTVLVNGKKVGPADVLASNGVIHVIDGVLLPTIVDTAVGYDDGTTTFKTLVAAVTAADLGPTLAGAGTFTVFAPTDKAFADLKTAIGAAAYDAILADKAKLATILKYHVLGAVAWAKDVTSGDQTPLAGGTFKVEVASGKVTITDGNGGKANVVLTDLPNSNGVIHVIDKVLVPKP